MKNELKESKISLLDKIKWRIKYRELSLVLGNDTPLMRGILKNKIIEEGYTRNKDEIVTILKKMKRQMPDKIEDAESIMVQTINNDYINEKFRDNEENTSIANTTEVLHNLEFMLNLGEEGIYAEENMTVEEKAEFKERMKAKKYIFNQLNVDECKGKNLKMEILPLLDYSEGTLKKYPLNCLKKLNFLSENDFKQINGLEAQSIIEAANRNVDNSSIYNYVQVCKYRRMMNDGFDKINFLSANMRYSEFFMKFIEKYNYFPSSDEIHELFNQTRDMGSKETMLNLHMDDKYYSELRNKYIDFEIENKLNNRNSATISEVKDLITKKYFNVEYSDIESIMKNEKQKVFSSDTQKIMKYVSKIQEINDVNALSNINKEIEKINTDIDIGKVFDEIYDYYAMDKLEGCFNPKEFTGKKQTISYKGKNVEVLKLQGEDYRGNVHVLGGRNAGAKNLVSNEERENKAKYETPLMFSMLDGYSDKLSLSTERDDSMAFFSCDKSNVILGFSDLKPQNVLGYYAGDGATSTGQGNYNKSIKNVKEKIDYNNKSRYDELLVSRYEDTSKIRKFRKDEKRILPNYILTFKGDKERPHLNYENMEDVYTKRILDYATTYNIPIVEMDLEKYIEKYQKKYDDVFAKMKKGKEKFEMKDFEDMVRYRRSQGFYKENNPRTTGETVFLETINDLNITKENGKTIKQIIERFDYQNYENWEEKNIYNFLPKELQEKAMKKMKVLRDTLQISNEEKITENDKKDNQIEK